MWAATVASTPPLSAQTTGPSRTCARILAVGSSTNDAIVVLKWKEVYDKLEDAIDQCEDVGNTLQNISLKNA